MSDGRPGRLALAEPRWIKDKTLQVMADESLSRPTSLGLGFDDDAPVGRRTRLWSFGAIDACPPDAVGA